MEKGDAGLHSRSSHISIHQSRSNKSIPSISVLNHRFLDLRPGLSPTPSSSCPSSSPHPFNSFATRQSSRQSPSHPFPHPLAIHSIINGKSADTPTSTTHPDALVAPLAYQKIPTLCGCCAVDAVEAQESTGGGKEFGGGKRIRTARNRANSSLQMA